MKKSDLLKVLTVMLCIVVFSASSFAAEKQKPKQKLMDNYIAVFDVETVDVDTKLSRPLTESIRRELVMSGKYEIIDRGNMNKILGEQKFQMSGCVAGQCIVEAGQLLGAGKIIAGSVSLVGKTYYLTLSLINVETGKIENVSEDECKCEVDDLIKSSKRLVKRLLGDNVPDSLITKAEKDEKAEKDRIERERLEKEKTEKDRIEKEKWEKERQEKLARGERFSLKEGVIEDFKFGLEWAPANGQSMNHYQAEEYARNLSIAGGGWRLPTVEELRSLSGNLVPDFNIKDGLFTANWVWSSELCSADARGLSVYKSSGNGARAYAFSNGNDYCPPRDNSRPNGRVLAVRSRR